MCNFIWFVSNPAIWPGCFTTATFTWWFSLSLVKDELVYTKNIWWNKPIWLWVKTLYPWWTSYMYPCIHPYMVRPFRLNCHCHVEHSNASRQEMPKAVGVNYYHFDLQKRRNRQFLFLLIHKRMTYGWTKFCGSTFFWHSQVQIFVDPHFFVISVHEILWIHIFLA